MSTEESVPQAPASINTFELTDAGNSERFAARYGSALRYCCEEKGWYGWDGKVWKAIPGERLVEYAIKVIRLIPEEANSNTERLLKLTGWRKQSESKQRITAMIELAKASLSVSKEVFDNNPYLLNCNNGIIDLKNWIFRKHSRVDSCTKVIAVDYEPTAQCPAWLQFLHEVFAPNMEVIPFIQRAVGYSLVGHVKEECFFLLYGLHRNGKGTFTGTLLRILGAYGGTIDFGSLVATRKSSGPKEDIVAMNGKRFVVAHENREGAKMASEVVKWLTGGDRIRARSLYQNSVEFDPTWKLWLATNHLPIISSTDPALWDRLRMIPFKVSFAGNEDRSLKQTLLEEAPGILMWAIEGYRLYAQEGLNPPACVRVCGDEYKRSMNPLTEFVEDECIIGDALSVVGKELFERYRAYSEESGNAYPVGRKKFTALLAEMGIHGGRASTPRGDRTYTGIRLRVSDTSDTSLQKSSPSEDSTEDLLDDDLSECQNPGIPLTPLRIAPCSICGCGIQYRHQPNEECVCMKCKPPGEGETVEYIYCVGTGDEADGNEELVLE